MACSDALCAVVYPGPHAQPLVERVGPAGNLDGAMLVASADVAIAAAVMVDDAGVVLVAWRTLAGVFARRIAPDGHVVDAAPIALAESPMVPDAPLLAHDGARFVIALYDPWPDGRPRTRVIRLDASGPTSSDDVDFSLGPFALACHVGTCLLMSGSGAVVFGPDESPSGDPIDLGLSFWGAAAPRADGRFDVVGPCGPLWSASWFLVVAADGTVDTRVEVPRNLLSPSGPAPSDGAWLAASYAYPIAGLTRLDALGETTLTTFDGCVAGTESIARVPHGRSSAFACGLFDGSAIHRTLADDGSAAGTAVPMLTRSAPDEGIAVIASSGARSWIRWVQGYDSLLAELGSGGMLSTATIPVTGWGLTAGRTTLLASEGLRSVDDLSVLTPLLWASHGLVFDGERYVGIALDAAGSSELVELEETAAAVSIAWPTGTGMGSGVIAATPTHRLYYVSGGFLLADRAGMVISEQAFSFQSIATVPFDDDFVVLAGLSGGGTSLSTLALDTGALTVVSPAVLPFPADFGIATRWHDDVMAVAYEGLPSGESALVGVRVAPDGSNLTTWRFDAAAVDFTGFACTSTECRLAYLTLDEATGRRRVALLELTLAEVGDACDDDADCASWICDLAECVPPGSIRHDGGVADASAALDAGASDGGPSVDAGDESDGSASLDPGVERHGGLAPGGGGHCACHVGGGGAQGWVIVGLWIGWALAARHFTRSRMRGGDSRLRGPAGRSRAPEIRASAVPSRR